MIHNDRLFKYFSGTNEWKYIVTIFWWCHSVYYDVKLSHCDVTPVDPVTVNSVLKIGLSKCKNYSTKSCLIHFVVCVDVNKKLYLLYMAEIQVKII